MAPTNPKTPPVTAEFADVSGASALAAAPYRPSPPVSALAIRQSGAIRGEVATLPPAVRDLAELLAEIAYRDLCLPTPQ